MRLLLKLRALKDQAYDLKYHHKLQGFIYSLLDGTPYIKLHDRRGYKFFCFSNIFPPKDAKAGNTRNLLISSPDAGMINALEDGLAQLKGKEEPVNIGEMSFKIGSIFRLEPKIGRSCTLLTGTPIVIRIPKENYKRYGIKPPKDYDYVYWKKDYPLDAFVKQLEENIFKKYKGFYGKTIGEGFTIFQKVEFLKQVSNRVVINRKEIAIIGTLWSFIFEFLSKEQEKLLTFALDSGFGELNSLGFGFINYGLDRRSHFISEKVKN